MSTSPAKWSILAWKNTDWGVSMTVKDQNTGDPINMTGWTGEMQIRDYQGAPGDPLLNVIVDIYEPEEGKVSLEIPIETMETLPTRPNNDDCGKPDVFHHDLLFTDDGGMVSVFAFGPFAVHDGVTR